MGAASEAVVARERRSPRMSWRRRKRTSNSNAGTFTVKGTSARSGSSPPPPRARERRARSTARPLAAGAYRDRCGRRFPYGARYAKWKSTPTGGVEVVRSPRSTMSARGSSDDSFTDRPTAASRKASARPCWRMPLRRRVGQLLFGFFHGLRDAEGGLPARVCNRAERSGLPRRIRSASAPEAKAARRPVRGGHQCDRDALAELASSHIEMPATRSGSGAHPRGTRTHRLSVTTERARAIFEGSSCRVRLFASRPLGFSPAPRASGSFRLQNCRALRRAVLRDQAHVGEAFAQVRVRERGADFGVHFCTISAPACRRGATAAPTREIVAGTPAFGCRRDVRK